MAYSFRDRVVIIVGRRYEIEIRSRHPQVVFPVFVAGRNQHVHVPCFQAVREHVQIEPAVQYGGRNKTQEDLHPFDVVGGLVSSVPAVTVVGTGVNGRDAFTDQCGVPER